MIAKILKDMKTNFRGEYEGKDGVFAIEYQDDDCWTVEHRLVSDSIVEHRLVSDSITCSQNLLDEEGNISWATRAEALTVAKRHAGIIPPIPLPDRRGLVAHSRLL